jgi:signal peptidase I
MLRPLPPTVVPAGDLAQDLLKRSGALRLKARGSSMLPFLLDGDVVHVRPAGAADVRRGDVICYRYRTAPERLFLHRLVARDGDTLVARGDALEFVDRVDPDELLGRAVAVERGDRIVRLDTRWARHVGRGTAWLSPLLARALAAALAARRRWRRAWPA